MKTSPPCTGISVEPQLFVIAYAPRGNTRPSSRLGLFVTAVRDGFHGRWRVLEATSQPYD
jgi:hypothetical protein